MPSGKGPVDQGNLRIASSWRLRNDGAYILAYFCSTQKLSFKVLSPAEASLVPFMDGELSDAEMRRLWGSVHGADDGETDRVFKALVGSLVERDGIVSRNGEPSASVKTDPARLIPDFASYEKQPKRLARPFSVAVGLTNRCGTNCLYCYAERPKQNELSRQEWRRVFDDLAQNEIFIVDLAGGDTLARPDALDLLEDMAERDFVFFLSTKCPITQGIAERLAALGVGAANPPPHLVRTLQISVDSVDPATADRLTGSKDYLQRAMDSARNAVAAGLAPRVKGVLTSLNADAVDGVVERFFDLGVRDFQFVQYGLSYYRPNEALFLSPRQKERLPDALARAQAAFPGIEITIQDDQTAGGPRNRTWEQWRSRALCSGGRNNLQIKANGEATLCDQVPSRPPFVVGNLLRQGLKEVWNSPELLSFLYPDRDSFRGTACHSCPEFEDCHQDKGYCYRDALFAYGTIFEAPPDCPRQDRQGLRQI